MADFFHQKIGCAKGDYRFNIILNQFLNISVVEILIGHVDQLVICVICQNFKRLKHELVLVLIDEKYKLI